MIGADRWIHKTGYRKFCTSWWKALPLVPFQIVKHRWQRMTRGWSDYDMADGEQFIADIISTTAYQYFAHTHGYPVHMTYEEWLDILLEICEGFSTLNEHHELVIPDMAWDLLRENIGGLW